MEPERVPDTTAPAQPNEPAAQPSEPAAQPHEPAAQPNEPAAQPHEPAASSPSMHSEASESIPPSGYSTPLASEPAKPLDPMQVKRFAFLLRQTDVFAHFIQSAIQDESLKAEIARQLESRDDKAGAGGASRRHRKTEKEEDAELLRDESPELADAQLVFSESPAY
ncbi:putative global transcription activator SNF2L1, partial [Coemansia erecta]